MKANLRPGVLRFRIRPHPGSGEFYIYGLVDLPDGSRRLEYIETEKVAG